MKKLLALIALVALVAFCTLFTKINTAAAPIETDSLAASVGVSHNGNASASKPDDVGSIPTALATTTKTLAARIVAVIEEIETQGNGNCSEAKGGSGEHGCLQFQPATWRAYSRELYGKTVNITQEREREVATFKVQQWLDAGYSTRQVFLIWNQGNPSPCKAGVNKFGVRFDSCAYANKGIALLGP